MRTSTLLMALLALSACGPTIPPPPAGGPIGELPDRGQLTDGQVAQILNTINQGEIELAELAIQKNAHPVSTQYARRMLTDHRALSARVERVGTRPDVVLAESPRSRQLRRETLEMMGRLRDLEGEAFARAYINSQVRLHEQAVTLARTELALEADDAQVRRLVSEALPILEGHHDLAIQARSRLQATVGT